MNKAEKEYRENLMEEHRKMIELRECGNNYHLCDKDGNFKSNYPKEDGKVSIGYLEDAMQWVFYNIEFDDKLERILELEMIVQVEFVGINYVPIWSNKLKNKS